MEYAFGDILRKLPRTIQTLSDPSIRNHVEVAVDFVALPSHCTQDSSVSLRPAFECKLNSQNMWCIRGYRPYYDGE